MNSPLVLDASVAVKILLPEEEHHDLALQLLTEFRSQLRYLIAPDILPAEMGHVLTKAERRGIIPKGRGKVLFDDFINPCIDLYPFGDLFDRAMEIASDFRVGFYDSCYAVLAEEQGMELVTTDEKLINSLPKFPIVHLMDV